MPVSIPFISTDATKYYKVLFFCMSMGDTLQPLRRKSCT